ncbi:MAG: DUF6049 family protein, partial [Leucobacter sp.]
VVSAEASLRLGVIVPLVLPEEIRTLPTRAQLDDLVPVWDRLLASARDRRATLAIDPRVVAGIRAYGEDAPEAARLFLSQLEHTALPSFLLQFADADPAAQAALGFTSLLAPSSLDFVSRFGTFPAASADGAEADGATASAAAEAQQTDGQQTDAAGGDSGSAAQTSADGAAASEPATGDADPAPVDPEAVLPTLEQLTAWPRGDSAAWPAENAVDAATLELLRSAGVETVVLGSDNVVATGGPRVDLTQGSALVTDAALGDAARDALSAPTETERAAGSARLAAQLAFAEQAGTDGLLLGLDRGATGDAEDPSLLLDMLGSLPWVEATPIAELPEGTAALRAPETADEEETEDGASESRVDLLGSAVDRESSVTDLGAVLAHPEYLSGYQRARLLELFSTRYAASDVDFADVAARFRERDSELLDGIRVISTQHTQLVGSSSRVPVQLRNALPFDAVVTVQADPASAALSVPERRFTDIVVPAEATERVLVSVRSRVSSGESGLVVTVSSTGGDLTVFTSTLPIAISSSVETVALGVLGALAALLLGFGIWRSVRRRGRAAADPSTASAE